MPVAEEFVREIFRGLENSDGTAFFNYVAADVDWTVMGAHPLAGHYQGKADFIAGTFAKLDRVLPKRARLHVENLIVENNQAVAALHWLATARNGMRFDNWHYWIVLFERERIVRVRTYLDSAMVARLFKENPIA